MTNMTHDDYLNQGDPIDNPENNMAEDLFENAIQDARELLAHDMPEILWDIAKESVAGIDVQPAWKDWFMDQREYLEVSVYDELYEEAKRLWEN